jgi:hypothetical protein
VAWGIRTVTILFVALVAIALFYGVIDLYVIWLGRNDEVGW